jgi:hypothetical protein
MKHRRRIKMKDFIDKHLDEAFNLQVENPPRKRSLRCSSLPYCGILDTLIPEEPEIGDLSGTLFMSMGSSAHEALQLFMCLEDKYGSNVWGSWKCRECGREKKYCFRPKNCCNQPMKYVEVDFRIGPLTGHCDLIVRYNKKFYVWEFKTTGLKPKKPKRQHLLQVRHYAAMVKRCFNILISGYVIVYVGRQFLERWKFGPYNAATTLQQTEDWLFRAIKNYKAATKARKDPSRENLLELVQSRPCKSIKDWKDYMSRAEQFKNNDCPMLSKCIAGTKICLNSVEEILNG